MPVYAGGFKDFIKKQFMPADQKFIIVEKDIKEQIFSTLEQTFIDVWNLNREEFLSNKEFKQELDEIGAKTYKDVFNRDKNCVNDLYNEFLKNKNNIAQNKEIYKDLGENFLDPYKEFKSILNTEIYKQAYIKYKEKLDARTWNLTSYADSNNGKTDWTKYHFYHCSQPTKDKPYLTCKPNFRDVFILEDWRQLKKEFLNKDLKVVNDIFSIMDENIAYVQKIRNEIWDYSKLYEEKKLSNYYKKYGNIKNGGNIRNVIVGGEIPQTGYYYDTLVTPLEVQQVINGGVLACDAFRGWESNNVYIMTNRKLVDGDTFTGRFLYKGIFKYTNVFGAQLTVRKFQEITVPSDNFYFVEKYNFFNNSNSL